MKVIKGRNVHEILPKAMQILLWEGVERESRNGPVLQHPETVSTIYEKPAERVIFHDWRDANPFFHFYESLWMLAGRNDVAPLTRYVKRMADFSDDGKEFHAAYGYRWRTRHNFFDQLAMIIAQLRKNPLDRRCVLQIWDFHKDLGYEGGDVPCNLTVTFQVGTDGKLNMVVFCRSNDIIWGCYGANAVHFSMLHEYMATASGYPIGTYTQISVNWHAYRNIFDKMANDPTATPAQKLLQYEYSSENPYVHEVKPYPIMSVDREIWDQDVRNFVTNDGMFWPEVFTDPFFVEVASPIVQAHDFFKAGKWAMAMMQIEKCMASDWRKACTAWLAQRCRE